TALTLASFFGLTEYLGLGDKAEAFFNCSDPAFFVVRDENQLTGDKHLELKGTINTPQPGFSYRFQFIGVDATQAYAVLSVGQQLSHNKRFGRGLPKMEQLQVLQKFTVPENVTMLRFRVEGLTPQPTEFMCDITQRPQS
ncbi:MAG: hypothetical protein K2Q32_02340, partial [Alphaproteobacteria bacterium]|nr:hypothetical protein [Alphaproteobacteria bacterium]